MWISGIDQNFLISAMGLRKIFTCWKSWEKKNKTHIKMALGYMWRGGKEKRRGNGGAVQAAWCYCSVSSRVSLDSTAIVGACLVAYAMRVLSTKLKSILYLGGLHCPCDYDSFAANVYSIRTWTSCVDWAAQAVCNTEEFFLSLVCPGCGLCESTFHCLAYYLARYLVDPASSHMLVSKIKPCMSKYKPE
jgi:hypothetical protein